MEKNAKIVRIGLLIVGSVILLPFVVQIGRDIALDIKTNIEESKKIKKFSKKIVQGLKEGSVIEIAGKYYEVHKDEIELPEGV